MIDKEGAHRRLQHTHAKPPSTRHPSVGSRTRRAGLLIRVAAYLARLESSDSAPLFLDRIAFVLPRSPTFRLAWPNASGVLSAASSAAPSLCGRGSSVRSPAACLILPFSGSALPSIHLDSCWLPSLVVIACECWPFSHRLSQIVKSCVMHVDVIAPRSQRLLRAVSLYRQAA